MASIFFKEYWQQNGERKAAYFEFSLLLILIKEKRSQIPNARGKDKQKTIKKEVLMKWL
jgi:hypothetical protein